MKLNGKNGYDDICQSSSWLGPFGRRVSSFFVQKFLHFLSNSELLSLLTFVFWSLTNSLSVLKSWSLCAKCQSVGIAFNFRTSLRWLFILRFNSVSALAVHIMANCIGLFVLVTLKRSRLDYLSAAECSVVWRAFSFSCGEGLSFRFIESYFVIIFDVL